MVDGKKQERLSCSCLPFTSLRWRMNGPRGVFINGKSSKRYEHVVKSPK